MPSVRLITPIMQAGTNTLRSPNSAATRNAALPVQLAAVATVAAFQRIFRVNETASGQGGIAEGGDHPLARLAFGITLNLNELQQLRALDLFGAEKNTPGR